MDALLGLDDDTRESPMKTALMTTSREMETQVGRRLAQLKVRSIKRELLVGCTKTIVLSCKIEATLSLSLDCCVCVEYREFTTERCQWSAAPTRCSHTRSNGAMPAEWLPKSVFAGVFDYVPFAVEFRVLLILHRQTGTDMGRKCHFFRVCTRSTHMTSRLVRG